MWYSRVCVRLRLLNPRVINNGYNLNEIRRVFLGYLLYSFVILETIFELTCRKEWFDTIEMDNNVYLLTTALILLTYHLTLFDAHVTFPQSFYNNDKNYTRVKRQAGCNEFQCASGECISEELHCDGAVNCKDGSDETFACRNIPCQPFLFRCSYGACINGNFECDGKVDCKDNSDETSAKCKRSVTTSPTTSTDCDLNQFKCKSGQCIEELDLCDGIVNCNDGSDETREACYSINCPKYTYKCAYGGCVDGNARCNGKQDCIDNSDEIGCKNIPVTTTTTTTTTTTVATIMKDSCIVPEPPVNGYITVQGVGAYRSGDEVPQGTPISYTCTVSHALQPNNSISYCIAGRWINEIPTCERVCEAIKTSDVVQAKCYKEENVVSCDVPFSGTRAKLSCGALFEDESLTLNPNRLCKDGTWDHTLPNCVPQCGMQFVTAQPLIIGGNTAQRDHWPWVVAVHVKSTKKLICGGSILNPKVILSAAHCFTDNNGRLLSPDLYLIGAGKHFRDFNHVEDVNSQYSDVQHIYIPAEYHGDTQNYRGDIAVVIVKEPFKLTKVVRPVCIDWSGIFEKEQLQTGASGVVLGWGLTIEGGDASTELKELEVPYHHLDECNERLPIKYRRFATTGDKMCGGYYNKSTSVCQGDSGGGYVFLYGKKYYIRGIVSVSPESPKVAQTCDSNQYTLFTLVSKYLDFIYQYESRYRPKF